MRETKERAIGTRGYVYHVTQFGAREGGRVLVRLLKLVGGAAGEAVQSEDDIDMGTIGKMIANLAESVSEADFDMLVDTFMKTTHVSGGDYRAPMPLAAEGVFDLHFAGAYAELGQWLLFAIEVNFGSFFGEAGIVRQAKAAVSARPVSAARIGDEVSRSKSPNTFAQNGQSGA
jgi:hypothetical protein